jgi:type II pantothenate kinase
MTEQLISKIIPNTVGIDAGESLTKIVYSKDKKLHSLLFSTKKEKEEINDFLTSNSTQYDRFHFTGGKSFEMYNRLKNKFNAKLINEFEANAKGTSFLYELENTEELKSSLLVSIGTGTSMVLLGDEIKHLGGSALGGAFFMGFLKLLFGETDYKSAIDLATKGDRYKIDLKVGDIYESEDTRVEPLFREFTAASFGKINELFAVESLKKEDLINSLICIVGENIGLLSVKTAELQNLENIVFCGGFLKNNTVLKSILQILCLVNQKKPIFLNNSEYIGALGIILK